MAKYEKTKVVMEGILDILAPVMGFLTMIVFGVTWDSGYLIASILCFIMDDVREIKKNG